MEKLKEDVQQKFLEIQNVLHMREKLLLRQADVIFQQLGRAMVRSSPDSEMRSVKFLVDQEDELLATIRSFGRFQLENMNLQDVLNNDMSPSDYISPKNDHETMYKCLQQPNEQQNCELETSNVDQMKQEAIIVDFSHNKSLIEHNTQSMNESIINITLQEAKELIKKAKLKRDTAIPPLNLEELDDELESSIAEAVSSLGHNPSSTNSFTQSSIEAKSTKATKKTQSSRCKPKITINNCNGTINLRNISSLTINCANEDSISAQIPCQMQQQKQHDIDDSYSEQMSASSTLHNQRNQKNNKCKESTAGKGANSNSSHKNLGLIEGKNDSSGDLTTCSGTGSSSNYSSSSSLHSQLKSQKNNNNDKQTKRNENTSQIHNSTSATYPHDVSLDYDVDDFDSIGQHAANCDFYNRLLNEIRKSLRNKHTIDNTHCIKASKFKHNETQNPETKNISPINTTVINSNTSSNTSSAVPNSQTTTTNTSANQTGIGRRLVLKNFENLRIVLEANSSDEESFHPVQIEQWLAEIISETDLEPIQNSEILEHSKIHNDKD